MENLYTEALKQYGLVGFVVVVVLLFAVFLVLKSFTHWTKFSDDFTKAITGNTNAMQAMQKDFTATLEKNEGRIASVLEKNTEAMHKMAQSNLILANTNENMGKTLERNINQAQQDHGLILDFMHRLNAKG